jgi:iron complex transport system ATP-binding protein
MNIINLKNISFRYSNDTDSNFHFENLNFTVHKGDYVSLLGPNGSGKSTLIKIIANILKPLKGVTKLYDLDYSAIKRNEFAKKVAFVPQNMSVNFPYSVYEIVMMGRSPYLNFFGIENKNDHDLVISKLELLEILHIKDKGINEVSGGEAQRALIARAFVQQPEILLLDEPNTHLDIKNQLIIFDLLKKLNKDEQLTIVSISHDLNLAKHYSNRVILMKKGKIEFDDLPNLVLTESNIKKVFDVETKIIPIKEDRRTHISLIP